MFNELKFDCPRSGCRYILLLCSATPLFAGEYEEVPIERAVHIVAGAISGGFGGPDLRMLQALGIREHPKNISGAELTARVSRVLFGIPRWQLLLEVKRRFAPVEVAPRVTQAPAREAEPRSFVCVEVISNEGKPVQGVRLALTLADGSVRSVVSDEHGRALATGIESGTCAIGLPELDASRWRPSGGSHTVVRKQSAGTHVVKQGECLSQIAHQHGFDDWQKLWNDAANAALKNKRKSPHVLLPGDQVALPGIELAQVERPTDATHRIIVSVKAPEVEVVLVFKDSEGEPRRDEPYELTFQHAGSEVKRSGTLDEAGRLREPVPVTVPSVQLSLTARSELYDILVGHLDPGLDAGSTPIESGALARLQGLGFISRTPGEEEHLDLRAGIKAFQERVMGETEPTGALDAATCAKLEETYGA